VSSAWYDINRFPQVCAWQAERSHAVNIAGVSDVITLHLQDHRDGSVITVVMEPDIAIKLGWDLIGEGGDFFAPRPRITESD
jgi:hypothetical protein